MPMSKLHAWTIFKSVTQGQEQGLNAVAALVGNEVTEYQEHVEQLNAEMAVHGIAAQNECAALFEANKEVAEHLELTPAHQWVAADYRSLANVLEGSVYEKLHFTAFFRVQNSELLFDLVKPAA